MRPSDDKAPRRSMASIWWRGGVALVNTARSVDTRRSVPQGSPGRVGGGIVEMEPPKVVLVHRVVTPPRVGSRNLFDVAVGFDNLFKGDKYRWSAQLTVVNMTNEYALYNFLSTFSGTHYVSPRSVTGQIGFHF